MARINIEEASGWVHQLGAECFTVADADSRKWLSDLVKLLQSNDPLKHALLSNFSLELSWFFDRANYLISACESPIEVGFLNALLIEAPKHGLPLEFYDHCLDAASRGKAPTQNLNIFPQHKVGKYRVDFWLTVSRFESIWSETLTARSLVVECDGHDFHEKTKAQAARDKARDRFLTSKGFSIMRFTGSEIHKDPHKCAEQVCAFLSRVDSKRKRGD